MAFIQEGPLIQHMLDHLPGRDDIECFRFDRESFIDIAFDSLDAWMFMGSEVQPCALPSILRKVVRKAPLRIPDIQQLSRRQMSEVVHDLLNPRVVGNSDPAVMRNLSFPDRLDPSSLFHHLLGSPVTHRSSWRECLGTSSKTDCAAKEI